MEISETEEEGEASLFLLSIGRDDHRWRGRVRDNKYKNENDNHEDGIHVRGKVVNAGSVSEGLGTTGSDQWRRPPNDKDKEKDKDKDEDNRP